MTRSEAYLSVSVGHLRGSVRALSRTRYHCHHLAPVLARYLHPAKIVCVTALLWIYEGCSARSAGHPEVEREIKIHFFRNTRSMKPFMFTLICFFTDGSKYKTVCTYLINNLYT